MVLGPEPEMCYNMGRGKGANLPTKKAENEGKSLQKSLHNHYFSLIINAYISIKYRK